VTRWRTAAIGVTALAMPVLAGCHAGKDAPTLQQGSSGNGAEVSRSDIQIDNATLVAGNPGSKRAAFLGTVYNPTDAPDALLSIAAGSAPAKLLPEPIPLPARQAVPIQTAKAAQAGFVGLEGEPGQYVTVTMTFQRAGEAVFRALIVPPSGYYAEAAPVGTSPLLETLANAIDRRVEDQAGNGAAEQQAAEATGSPTAP
jgi:hypothetical protein